MYLVGAPEFGKKKQQKNITKLLYKWSANSSKECDGIHSVLQAKAYYVLSWN